MYRHSMHNPIHARHVWNRLRARRPLGRVHPADRKRQEALAAGEKVREELAEHFAKSCGREQHESSQQRGNVAMIKLNCGVSRKVGEPNYGSRGASVNVELELESSVVQDAELLHEKIRKLFALAKASVDEELGLTGRPNGASAAPAQAPSGNGQAPGHPGANGNRSRPATESQLRAVWAICNGLGLDQDQEATRMFQRPASQLALSQASKLIDHLKQLQAGQNGQ
ncbi:MAG: hypothetical protein WBF17_05075 [Phycisphaerae bacterium]